MSLAWEFTEGGRTRWLMAAQNLSIYNTCLEPLIRNGATGYWTDAIYPLAGRLYEYQSNEIDVVAWGMLNSLRWPDHGRLRLADLSFLLRRPEWRDEDRNPLKTGISNADLIFVNLVGIVTRGFCALTSDGNPKLSTLSADYLNQINSCRSRGVG